MKNYTANAKRYEHMTFSRCGKSGVLLPRLSLGFWHNFGAADDFAKARELALCAFDNGITHFDLANNYGPPPGSAEQTFGRILKEDLGSHRDELFISTKAGYEMWAGPYGNWGSRKSMLASLDQSLSRMGLEYVDLFYSHRYDPSTPLEETLQALVDAVRMGKALYAGISRWPLEALEFAVPYLRERDVPLLIYQGRLNLLDRAPQEEGITAFCEKEGIGFISFSPLAQGLLSNRYLHGIPAGSRMTREHFLRSEMLTPELLSRLHALNSQAAAQGQSLSEMALTWLLRQPALTSILVGVSSKEQLLANIRSVMSQSSE